MKKSKIKIEVDMQKAKRVQNESLLSFNDHNVFGIDPTMVQGV